MGAKQKVLLSALAVWLVFPLGGCRKSDMPRLVAVSGVVQFDGKPLARILVDYVPVGKTPGIGGAGITDSNGRYELKTRSVHLGVPPGEYRVTCRQLPPVSATPEAVEGVSLTMAETKQSLPAKYHDAEKSILSAIVPNDGGKVDFDLKSSW